MEYNFQEIEQKWRKFWAENKTFAAFDNSIKPKYYVLDMFPYPSGAGLHVGHPLGYIASDIFSRYKRLKGFNVLHPMGYDSFGLPAEQYAIQTGQHPAKTTKQNIERYRDQLDKIGFSFDWSREVKTSDQDYYKWTQWIFSQIFDSWFDLENDKARPIEQLINHFQINGNHKINAFTDFEATFDADEWNAYDEEKKEAILQNYRLTYLADTWVNWCPALGTVLANDEVINGKSERGGHPVVQKKMKQWSMRIKAYGNRLLEGLEGLDWTESIKDQQRNWIGKSKGASVNFQVKNTETQIEVFTTRPDTIFGVSFIVLAPEHPLVNQITSENNKAEVKAYQDASALKSERDRQSETKKISGVFTGAYAVHPFTGEDIPLWIGDYVLASYGTGAVMSVPSGDQRDYDFAKHFDLEIPNVFENVDISEQAYTEKTGVIKNSDFLNGLKIEDAIPKAIEAIEHKNIGKGKINFRLRDAVFSRQRYWGEPFPIYYKNGIPKLIDVAYLPIVLPVVEKYLPTEDGDPPLGNSDTWAWDAAQNLVVSNDLIDNETVFPLELNTMPGWAGSSWYFARYTDPNNSEVIASKEKLNYWGNVDLYIGGSEHATGHLLYARFWTKFLYDLAYLPYDEPFQKMINQGMILGKSAIAYIGDDQKLCSFDVLDQNNLDKYREVRISIDLINDDESIQIEKLRDWQPEYKDIEVITNQEGKIIVKREVDKMSKRWFNVVTPDDLCEKYGADTLRMYEMFLGPLEQSKPWDTKGISGVHSFLKKLWRLMHDEKGNFNLDEQKPSKEALKTLHKTIKKLQDDLERFSFNTGVSAFMICVNELQQMQCNNKEIIESLIILLSPYAPHFAEEIWEKLGHKKGSISYASFPEFDEKHLEESEFSYPVSFNGKMRLKIDLPLDLSAAEIEERTLSMPEIQKWLEGKSPKKSIIVPGRIINFVI